MLFAIGVCKRAEVKETALDFWFGRRSKDTQKSRLHGWRPWHTYCIETDISMDDMISV
jgi:hypothetical protein